MPSMVEQRIDEVRAWRRGPLIGYLPAGFPNVDTSVDAAVALAENGVDIIEFGVPYSDPVMDGPVIQSACQQALSAGFRIADLFTAIERVRSRVDVPILVMSYYNLMLQQGIDNYARTLRDCGAAGAITPDLIPDEAGRWLTASERVFLAASTSSDARLNRIIEHSRGFVYTVSTLGVTGARADVDASARELSNRLHRLGAPRACVGIGISTSAQVAEVLEYAEGAIVGSALVRALAEGGVQQLAATAANLAEGTR